jgi:FkbM family methyltransferase
MPIINYMNQYQIEVSNDTLIKTPITFNPDGTYFEPESVEYFYNLVKSKCDTNLCNIVDIGAQSGLYTLYAKYMQNCRFYSFEPNFFTFELLKENCKLNNITNVSLRNMGLGNKIETKSLKLPTRTGESGFACLCDSPIRFSDYNMIEVHVTTLDTEFYERNIPVHFIKCDTEGWEVFILEGGEKTITTYKPEIFLEVCDANLKQCSQTRENLFSILEQYGYKYVNTLNNENFHFTPII